MPIIESITKSTGIIALMRFLKDLVEILGLDKVITVEDFFLSVFKVFLVFQLYRRNIDI